MADIAGLIPELNPYTDLPDHFMMILYGIRRSGKTVMLRHMFYEMRERLRHHEVYLFSATADLNPSQYDFIPKIAQFTDIKNIDYHLRKILDGQKPKVEKWEAQKKKSDREKLFDDKDMGKDDHEKNSLLALQPTATVTMSRAAAMEEILHPDEFSQPDDYHPVLLILDDVVNENSIRHSSFLNLVAVGGRHIHISCIILSQLVSGSGSVPPIIRTQADLVGVVAQPRSLIERNLLSEQYLTSENRPSSKADGLRLMNAVTEKKHRALFISTVSSNARSYLDYCFKYGPVPYPPVDPDFKLGIEEQWNCSAKQDKGKKKPKHLPNPFAYGHDLHTDKHGEYLNALTEDLYW